MTLGSSDVRLRYRRRAIALLATMLSVSPVTGDVIHVDDDAPGGDGSTWALAYTHLQDALDAAQPGSGVHEVRVGQGEYRPDRRASHPDGDGDRTASFDLIEGVTIAGGFAGFDAADPDRRDIREFETVLSGDLAGDDMMGGDNGENSHHVVRADFLPDRAALAGVTVRAGNTDGDSFSNGGGLRIAHSAVTVSDCTFVGNATHPDRGSGGALAASGGPTVIERCTFKDNRAVEEFSTTAGGGALWIIDDVTVVDSVFTGNNAWNGGAIFVTGDAVIDHCTFTSNTAERGGAIFRRKFTGVPNDILIVGADFERNIAGESGGAIHFETGDDRPRILNSRFIANTAGTSGGAVSRLAFGAIVSNCLFAGNRAVQLNGGAMMTEAAGIRLYASTFVANTAGNEGGGIYQIDNNPPAVINTIFWNNADASGMTEPGQIARAAAGYDAPRVDYCVVQGLTGEFGGDGNFDADPQFVDPHGPDGDPDTFGDNVYAIVAVSPCVDAGHNWGGIKDEADLDGDNDYDECTPIDLSGAPRFTDCAPVDSGCGAPVTVDIGAHEADGTPVNPMRLGDIDADGSITFGDLLLVLANWGDDPAECLADIDLDGTAGFSEILILLASW